MTTTEDTWYPVAIAPDDGLLHLDDGMLLASESTGGVGPGRLVTPLTLRYGQGGFPFEETQCCHVLFIDAGDCRPDV